MMTFGFVTCVQLGLACMEEIYAVGGRLDLAMTLHDELSQKKSGRCSLDAFCKEKRLDLVKIKHVNDKESVAAIQDKEIDWLFVIGWSQIVGPEVLNAPRRGVLGMHPTLLPEGRGRASIPWAILKGLEKTGVTLFKLEAGVDTGPILAQEVLPIAPDETATTLYEKATHAHRILIRNVWDDLVKDNLKPILQDESKATVWPGRKPEDGRITCDMTVNEVDRMVRAVTHPYPGAFFEKEGNGTTIWRGQIGDSATPPADGNLRLYLRDGVYDALDFQIYPL